MLFLPMWLLTRESRVRECFFARSGKTYFRRFGMHCEERKKGQLQQKRTKGWRGSTASPELEFDALKERIELDGEVKQRAVMKGSEGS